MLEGSDYGKGMTTWFLCYPTVSDIEMGDVISFVDVAAIVNGVFCGLSIEGRLHLLSLETLGRQSHTALGQPSKVQGEWPLLFLALAPWDFVFNLEKKKVLWHAVYSSVELVGFFY